MSELLKGIISIWSRLFDHRAFLNGEIQFLLKEFEQNRSDQEVTKLFEIVETIADFKDTQLDRSKSLTDSLFPQIQLSLSEALETCAKAEGLELDFQLNETLKAKREERKTEWDTFIDSISEDCENINENFDKQEADLYEHYKNL